MDDSHLSIRELAKRVKMSEKNLKQLVLEHSIPHNLVRGKTMVHVRHFDSWMAANLKGLSCEKLESIETDEKNRLLKIGHMLQKDKVIFNPPDLTKKDILKRLVETLVDSGAAPKKHYKTIFKAVIDRERLCSTAIADGVAIPHPRSAMEGILDEPHLVLAISPRGIDFESDDGKATNLFFLICSDRTEMHLKVMARLSRLLRSAKFRHELITATDFETVKAVYDKWEKKLKTLVV